MDSLQSRKHHHHHHHHHAHHRLSSSVQDTINVVDDMHPHTTSSTATNTHTSSSSTRTLEALDSALNTLDNGTTATTSPPSPSSLHASYPYSDLNRARPHPSSLSGSATKTSSASTTDASLLRQSLGAHPGFSSPSPLASYHPSWMSMARHAHNPYPTFGQSRSAAAASPSSSKALASSKAASTSNPRARCYEDKMEKQKLEHILFSGDQSHPLNQRKERMRKRLAERQTGNKKKKRRAKTQSLPSDPACSLSSSPSANANGLLALEHAKRMKTNGDNDGFFVTDFSRTPATTTAVKPQKHNNKTRNQKRNQNSKKPGKRDKKRLKSATSTATKPSSTSTTPTPTASKHEHDSISDKLERLNTAFGEHSGGADGGDFLSGADLLDHQADMFESDYCEPSGGDLEALMQNKLKLEMQQKIHVSLLRDQKELQPLLAGNSSAQNGYHTNQNPNLGLISSQERSENNSEEEEDENDDDEDENSEFLDNFSNVSDAHDDDEEGDHIKNKVSNYSSKSGDSEIEIFIDPNEREYIHKQEMEPEPGAAAVEVNQSNEDAENEDEEDVEEEEEEFPHGINSNPELIEYQKLHGEKTTTTPATGSRQRRNSAALDRSMTSHADGGFDVDAEEDEEKHVEALAFDAGGVSRAQTVQFVAELEEEQVVEEEEEEDMFADMTINEEDVRNDREQTQTAEQTGNTQSAAFGQTLCQVFSAANSMKKNSSPQPQEEEREKEEPEEADAGVHAIATVASSTNLSATFGRWADIKAAVGDDDEHDREETTTTTTATHGNTDGEGVVAGGGSKKNKESKKNAKKKLKNATMASKKRQGNKKQQQQQQKKKERKKPKKPKHKKLESEQSQEQVGNANEEPIGDTHEEPVENSNDDLEQIEKGEISSLNDLNRYRDRDVEEEEEEEEEVPERVENTDGNQSLTETEGSLKDVKNGVTSAAMASKSAFSLLSPQTATATSTATAASEQKLRKKKKRNKRKKQQHKAKESKSDDDAMTVDSSSNAPSSLQYQEDCMVAELGWSTKGPKAKPKNKKTAHTQSSSDKAELVVSPQSTQSAQDSSPVSTKSKKTAFAYGGGDEQSDTKHKKTFTPTPKSVTTTTTTTMDDTHSSASTTSTSKKEANKKAKKHKNKNKHKNQEKEKEREKDGNKDKDTDKEKEKDENTKPHILHKKPPILKSKSSNNTIENANGHGNVMHMINQSKVSRKERERKSGHASHGRLNRQKSNPLSMTSTTAAILSCSTTTSTVKIAKQHSKTIDRSMILPLAKHTTAATSAPLQKHEFPALKARSPKVAFNDTLAIATTTTASTPLSPDHQDNHNHNTTRQPAAQPRGPTRPPITRLQPHMPQQLQPHTLTQSPQCALLCARAELSTQTSPQMTPEHSQSHTQQPPPAQAHGDEVSSPTSDISPPPVSTAEPVVSAPASLPATAIAPLPLPLPLPVNLNSLIANSASNATHMALYFDEHGQLQERPLNFSGITLAAPLPHSATDNHTCTQTPAAVPLAIPAFMNVNGLLSHVAPPPPMTTNGNTATATTNTTSSATTTAPPPSLLPTALTAMPALSVAGYTGVPTLSPMYLPFPNFSLEQLNALTGGAAAITIPMMTTTTTTMTTTTDTGNSTPLKPIIAAFKPSTKSQKLEGIQEEEEDEHLDIDDHHVRQQQPEDEPHLDTSIAQSPSPRIAPINVKSHAECVQLLRGDLLQDEQEAGDEDWLEISDLDASVYPATLWCLHVKSFHIDAECSLQKLKASMALVS